jgi:hypothetical protein
MLLQMAVAPRLTDRIASTVCGTVLVRFKKSFLFFYKEGERFTVNRNRGGFNKELVARSALAASKID